MYVDWLYITTGVFSFSCNRPSELENKFTQDALLKDIRAENSLLRLNQNWPGEEIMW